MESILDLDYSIFQLINHGMKNSLFDMILPLLRERWIWIPLYAFLIGFILHNFKFYPALVFLGFLFITVGFTDGLCSKILKKEIGRDRPCRNDQIKVISLAECGSGYSMPSTHAANHFALSLFLILGLSRLTKAIRIPLILWASLISIAQVYVGVHYPSDIIIGAFFGIFMTFLFHMIYLRLFVPHYPLFEKVSGE